ncbi:sensor domain-containing diguanylate cyclase [Ideonella paludis]|uniref:diguanylate cyclase n=1 Tax=Ideonella paludis TaxID=1233411 RepID=A0ABS5E1S5_9BURK|nr:diguanylate cyclase [Ideonella paludis]MBQ0937249.1 GGDEF domain-containing protein [Ideonella paludis]
MGLLWPSVALANFYDVELAYHVDDSLQQSAAQVQALPESAWRSNGSRNLSLGYTQAAVWFRIRVTSLAAFPQEGLLEIGYPVLGSLRIYQTEHLRDHTLAPLELGAERPFSQRLIRHRNFVLPLNLSSGESTEWLVRVETKTSMQFPITMHDRAVFEDEEQSRLIAHGVYVGVVLAMLAYNAYLLIALRDIVYLWYIGWMLTFAGFVLTIGGMSYQWLWPNAPSWNLTALPMLLSLATLCGVLFMSSLVQLQAHSRWGWRMSRVLVALQLTLALGALVLPYKLAILMAIGGAVICMLGVMFLAARLAVQQVATARMFLMTFSVVVLAGCLLAASKLGWLPASRWIDHAPQISSALEMLLFSIVLAARMEAERKLREQTQRDMLAQHVQWKAELETKVAERTDELKQLNHSLAKLSRTDALTGLFNRRYLEECIDTELARSQQEGLQVALYMVDIDHFKRLNDTHGHAAGDVCLRAVAQRLLACTRPGQDVLVRWGGEEFCLVALWADTRQAADMGEQLRAAVCDAYIEHGALQMKASVSIGLAVGSPRTRLEMLDLQQRADESLYAAKALGRNRCVCATLPSGLGSLLPA